MFKKSIFNTLKNIESHITTQCDEDYECSKDDQNILDKTMDLIIYNVKTHFQSES